MQSNSSDTDRDTVDRLLEGYDNSKNAQKTTNSPLLFSKRFLVMVLLFLGSINMSTIRTHVGIALVEMTSNKTTISDNQTTTQPPEYSWDSKTVAVIISMFSYGYIGSVAGGIVSTKFGCSRTYGISMILASLVTLLNPASLRINFYLFLAFRLITGLFESFAYSCNSEIFSRWTPIKERSALISYSLSGIYIGTALNYPFCGFLAHKWGWPMVFYAIGSIGFVFSLLWLIFVRDDPSEDKWISEKELMYIQESNDNSSRKQIVHPYKSILTSKPFWALCMLKFAYGCGHVITVMCFPLYIKDMTHRSIDKIGLISAIPQITCIFTFPIAGILLDWCQNHRNFKMAQVYKFVISVSLVLLTMLLVIVAYVSNFIVAMSCFILIGVLLSLVYLLAQLVNISMAPKHSSVIAGFASLWFTMCSIIMPNVIGFIVVNHTLEEWSTCFLVSAGIFMFTCFFFMLYGSSELQPWAFSDNDDVEKK